MFASRGSSLLWARPRDASATGGGASEVLRRPAAMDGLRRAAGLG